MTTFKCGDMVVLKSGSDAMTVKSQDGNIVNCVWMVKGVVNSGNFESEMLELYDPTGGFGIVS